MRFEQREAIDLHVIDALDSETARNGCSEALALRYRLRDTSISIVSHYAWDETTLRSAIKRVTFHRKTYVNPRKFLPFLHIACHGLPDGLLVGDEVPIPWETLLQLLLPLQERVDYTLPLTISSCHGFFGYRVALQQMEEFRKARPYYVLIGPQSGLSTAELVASTSQLYRTLLHEYGGLPKAIHEANAHIKDPAAHLAYTYGTDVLNKFEKHGVDDKQLFTPPPKRSQLPEPTRPPSD